MHFLWVWLFPYLVFTWIHNLISEHDQCKIEEKNQIQTHKNKSRPQIHDLLYQFYFPTFHGKNFIFSIPSLAFYFRLKLVFIHLLLKNDHRNCHGFIAYVKDEFPYGIELKNEELDLLYMWFQVAVVNFHLHSLPFSGWWNCNVQWIAKMNDNTLFASFHIFGDSLPFTKSG